MSRPQLWLLVGGNGAGKTTFYRESAALRTLPFVNADLIARRLSPDAPDLAIYDAARSADDLRRGYLGEGETFCAETVFSHPSKVTSVPLIFKTKSTGYGSRRPCRSRPCSKARTKAGFSRTG